MPSFVETRQYQSELDVVKRETGQSSIVAFRATAVADGINDFAGKFNFGYFNVYE